MGLFPLKVTRSRRSKPIASGLAVLSLQAALPIMTLHQPTVQKLGPPSTAPPKLRRKALLIGVNGEFAAPINTDEESDSEEESHSQIGDSYNTRGDTISPLKGPREDVRGLKRLLIDHYSFKEEEITLLVDDGDDNHEQPTRGNIILAIESFVSGALPFDQFVFAFAGHGLQKKAKEEDEEEDGFNEYIVASCGGVIKDNGLASEEETGGPFAPNLQVDGYLRQLSLSDVARQARDQTLLQNSVNIYGFVPDLEHSKCNRVYMPWINKGKRRSRTLQYQTKKRYGLMPDKKRRSRTSGSAFGSLSIHAYPLEGRKAHSRPSLRAQTFEDNIHGNWPSKRRHHTSVLSQERATESGSISGLKISQPVPRKPQRRYSLTIDVSGNSTSGNGQTQPMRILENGCDMMESPTEIKCASPPPRYSCDGETCRLRENHNGHRHMADVICLSSSQDGEPTWEDGKGRSMISHLIKILEKRRNPTLHRLMTEIGHRIHQSNLRLHEQALKFRKEERVREAVAKADGAHAPENNRRRSHLEMTHFQRPELSSRVPLNMDEKLWVL